MFSVYPLHLSSIFSRLLLGPHIPQSHRFTFYQYFTFLSSITSSSSRFFTYFTPCRRGQRRSIYLSWLRTSNFPRNEMLFLSLSSLSLSHTEEERGKAFILPLLPKHNTFLPLLLLHYKHQQSDDFLRSNPLNPLVQSHQTKTITSRKSFVLLNPLFPFSLSPSSSSQPQTGSSRLDLSFAKVSQADSRKLNLKTWEMGGL